MKKTFEKFELVLQNIKQNNSLLLVKDFELKISVSKWSKKEILGHLIDSAVNNLQRFTEVQFFDKPYQVRPYNQDESVKYNDYQNKNNQDIIQLWLHLNSHILEIIKKQTTQTLQYEIILPNGDVANLLFLIEDYVEHLFYHLKQINHEF